MVLEFQLKDRTDRKKKKKKNNRETPIRERKKGRRNGEACINTAAILSLLFVSSVSGGPFSTKSETLAHTGKSGPMWWMGWDEGIAFGSGVSSSLIRIPIRWCGWDISFGVCQFPKPQPEQSTPLYSTLLCSALLSTRLIDPSTPTSSNNDNSKRY